MKAVVKNREIKIDFDKVNNTVHINGKVMDADVVKTSTGSFHVLSNNQSFNAEVLEVNETGKEMIIRINGNKYTVNLHDKYDELLHQLGMDKMVAAKVNDLKAPMPGLVLEVLVQEGQQIKKGDNLVVLEAMKMENNLKAVADATVKKVKVAKGDRVEKNEIMIELS